MDPIVIVGGKRTPMGGFQGDLAAATAPQLGAVAIKGAIADAGLTPEDIDQGLMGCVLPAGIGQAPARQAMILAGVPKSAPAATVNKMCGSGMKAVMDAHDQLVAGSATIMVAGGMESMTNAPYLLPKVRAGLRMGHSEVKDHMFTDGLEDPFGKGGLMGTFAEETARVHQFTRAEQDAYAIESLKRAQNAISSGAFAGEVAPVTLGGRGGETIVAIDEQPGKARLDKIPTLKPAFAKDGTVTAANSSSISDGAAALVMMRESVAKARGLKIKARILGHASHSQEPEWFTTAPIGSIETLLKKVGWSAGEVDLYEINEAFAVVAMVAMRELGLDHSKVNIHGGACALGHPVGATGARLIVTLMAALERYGKTKGIASLCIGGGEATAVAIERVA